MELIWVIKAEYVEEYKLKLFFSDNTTGTVDLRSSLNGPIFEPLREVVFFKNFKVNSWTVEWPNGADFAPEYLYQLATQHQLEMANK